MLNVFKFLLKLDMEMAKANDIVVVGAGGHAKVCIELLVAMGEQVAWCIGENDSPTKCAGVPVLIGDENLQKLSAEGYHRAFIAIGTNSLRKKLADLAGKIGYQLVNAISPGAIISPSARLGIGIAIMGGVVINAESVIGDLTIINTGAAIDHDCIIGEAVHIGPQSGLAGKVTIGSHSFLGIGCKVVPEIKVGEHVTIGAGAVVINSIESKVTVLGVPARKINSI